MSGYPRNALAAQHAPADSSGTDRLLYRPEEAAELLAISRTTLEQLLGRGEIESFKIGHARRIPAGALDDFIARRLGGVDK